MYLDILFDLLEEPLVYEPLVHCPCILQFEPLVAEKALAYDERLLLLIELLKLDLVATKESIHKAQQLVLADESTRRSIRERVGGLSCRSDKLCLDQ